MWHVVVPLAKPAIAAVALFQFLYAWNDFFGPLLYTGNNPKIWTLASGCQQFTSGRTAACCGTSRWRRRCCSCCR